jgi:hypothetical protein
MVLLLLKTLVISGRRFSLASSLGENGQHKDLPYLEQTLPPPDAGTAELLGISGHARHTLEHLLEICDVFSIVGSERGAFIAFDRLVSSCCIDQRSHFGVSDGAVPKFKGFNIGESKNG